MFIQSLIKSDSGEAEQEDEVELLSKQDREDYNVMPHFKNRVSSIEYGIFGKGHKFQPIRSVKTLLSRF